MAGLSANRFAGCFVDYRSAELIEHEVRTLVGQRIFAIALGYEDLNDHDHLRHDPVMALLAGKLEARRQDCAPVAGKSTLNRLELSRPTPTRYHKISHEPAPIERLRRWIEARGEQLSWPLSIVVQLFNPTAIVVGGLFPRPIYEALLARVDLGRLDHPGRMPLPKPALQVASVVGPDAMAVTSAAIPIAHLLGG